MKTVQWLLCFSVTILPLSGWAAAEAAPVAVVAANPWDAIKELTYQKRADFIAGAARLTESIDRQVRQLKEKRATLPETSVKEWDFAMKELTEAHALLKSTIAELSDATAETWDQMKERVGQAWQRAQTACDKVRASTTS